VTYRFQATMHSQRSYPYATGNSRPATVRIRWSRAKLVGHCPT